MRVVHYTQAFSQLSETAIYTWVTELQRQGVDCHVMTRKRLHDAERPFEPVHIVPVPRPWDADRLWWRGMEALGRTTAETSWYTTVHKRMEKAFRRLRPDVLHVHFGNDAWILAPAAQAAGVPMVVTFHGYDISELVKQDVWRRRYREGLWPFIQFATVLSEEMREAVEAQGCPPEKVRIVHVGRRVDEMPVWDPEEGGAFTVVSIGRLTEKKGHSDAIAAIGKLVAENRDVRLRIFGGGDLRTELERQIVDEGLGEFITLEGSRPNDEAVDALRRADAFMLCSKTALNGDREGTPNVFVEAQGVGVPCVATEHAGIPEMIPESNRWLLSPEGDVEGIAKRLARLMDMAPEKRAELGERGRQKVRVDYNLVAECEKFRALYHTASSLPTD